MLNVLHSLVDKSNINRQLEVYTSGGKINYQGLLKISFGQNLMPVDFLYAGFLCKMTFMSYCVVHL